LTQYIISADSQLAKIQDREQFLYLKELKKRRLNAYNRINQKGIK